MSGDYIHLAKLPNMIHVDADFGLRPDERNVQRKCRPSRTVSSDGWELDGTKVPVNLFFAVGGERKLEGGNEDCEYYFHFELGKFESDARSSPT